MNRQDLGSILTFLRICNPLNNPDFQTRLLLRPLKNGDPAGAELLRVGVLKAKLNFILTG
jgi:SWI/SNF-related matrix-associated actin-dependent regulator of chromatin subfamily A3